MTSLDQRLSHLLQQIHQGKGELALASIDDLLSKHPTSLGLMTLRAEALRSCGKELEAIDAYQKAALMGAPEHNWIAAGILLGGLRRVDEALACFDKANSATPHHPQVLDAYITTLFNNNRYFEGIHYARQQLSNATNALYLSNAALLLQSCDLYDEASEAFKKIHRLEPDNTAVLGPALVAARFTCEWEWIEYLQQRILNCYQANDFDAPQEYPLTHLTWCSDEALNLKVTQAYLQRMVPQVKAITPDQLPDVAHRRIRVGYLSCDFRNHATLHLMMGMLEAHQRSRFEIFAYDFTPADESSYRQRFLKAVEHHVNIQSMTDEQAAHRIAQDRLDLLIDLKLYTGGSRAGILAYRPAPLQAAYLGFPGSAASHDIDYIFSDVWVTPDSSKAFYTEKLCRLPHSYQCNDQRRTRPVQQAQRSDYGLPKDQVVFAAFNQSYKIDRLSFSLWMQVLQEVPHSVLWLLGQSDKAQSQLLQEAQAAGVSPQRLLFAPFVDPQHHLARLPLADAMLDTLVCNGHTTTSDALWMGVPVITRQGAHFASRVSESLLHAVNMPELIGKDSDDMLRIAKQLGLDPTWRQHIQQRLAAHIESSALFDTLRFTRDFERAITLMVERSHAGLAPDHMDLLDQPLAACTTSHTHCPVCESTQFQAVGQVRMNTIAPPLPTSRIWMRCSACAHLFVKDHWNDQATALMDEATEASSFLKEVVLEHDARRMQWAQPIERVIHLTGGYDAQRLAQTRWLDVGCGDASLVMTAQDYGFDAMGIEIMTHKTQALSMLSISKMSTGDWLKKSASTPVDILSLHNVLECLAYPLQALKHAHRSLSTHGLLIVSMPDTGCSSWQLLEKTGSNPYWAEPELQHLFSRASLIDWLDKIGFQVVDISVTSRFKAQIEIYARKR